MTDRAVRDSAVASPAAATRLAPNRTVSAAPPATSRLTTMNLVAAKPLVLSEYCRAWARDRWGPIVGRTATKPLAAVAHALAPIAASHVTAKVRVADECRATTKAGTAVPASRTGRPTMSGAQL